MDFKGGNTGFGDSLGFIEEGKGAEGGECRAVVERVVLTCSVVAAVSFTPVFAREVGAAIDGDGNNDVDDEDEFVFDDEGDSEGFADGGDCKEVEDLSTVAELFCILSSSEALVLLFFSLSSASLIAFSFQ